MTRGAPADAAQPTAAPLSLAPLGGRRIGPHLPLAAGFAKAAERAVSIGATAVQMFSDNPTAWRRRAGAPPEITAFRERLAQQDIGPTAIHGPYLVNLAGSDRDFWERSVETLVADLRIAEAYGAAFLNIHIGSHRGHGRDAGVARLAEGLSTVLGRAPHDAGAPLLVLENSAGGGDGIGSTIEDLADILEAAAAAGADTRRLGFCLDTAHLWGAGYDVADPDAVDAVLEQFDRRLGAESLSMIHLNDSRSARGSRLDRHEHIGAGAIGYRGMRHVLTHPRLASVPTFLETPGMEDGYDAVNMERVRLLIAGAPLPDLPPEAFAVRGSRSRTAPPEGADTGTA